MEKEIFDKAVKIQEEIEQLKQKIYCLKNANMIVISDNEMKDSEYSSLLEEDNIFENARQNRVKMLKFKLKGLHEHFANLENFENP